MQNLAPHNSRYRKEHTKNVKGYKREIHVDKKGNGRNYQSQS